MVRKVMECYTSIITYDIDGTACAACTNSVSKCLCVYANILDKALGLGSRPIIRECNSGDKTGIT